MRVYYTIPARTAVVVHWLGSGYSRTYITKEAAIYLGEPVKGELVRVKTRDRRHRWIRLHARLQDVVMHDHLTTHTAARADMARLLTHELAKGTRIEVWHWGQSRWVCQHTTRVLRFGIDHVQARHGSTEHLVFERFFVGGGVRSLHRVRVRTDQPRLTVQGRQLRERYLERWAQVCQNHPDGDGIDRGEGLLRDLAPVLKRAGLPSLVFVFSRTEPGQYHSVTLRSGSPSRCSCPSVRPCRHLTIASACDRWWQTARRWLVEGYRADELARVWLNTLSFFGFEEALRRFEQARAPRSLAA